jgi:hypothetical protein
MSIGAVFGATVLAAVVLLVLNTGMHTSGKMQAQDASDASALSATTWVARGLNVISMNNVIESQLLAIAILIPSLYGGIQDAIKVINVELPGCALLTVGAAACEAYLLAEESALSKVELVLTPLVSTAQPPSGALWTLMRALQAESELTARTFPAIAMAEALRVARNDGIDGAIVLARNASSGFTPTASLPVRIGAVAELCGATRDGSPAEHSRGY